jgi:hypothetical protein
VKVLKVSVVRKSLRLVLSSPFTSLHATTHRWQPTHRVVSTRIDLLMVSTFGAPAGKNTTGKRSAAQPLQFSAREMPRNSAEEAVKYAIMSVWEQNSLDVPLPLW